MLRIVTYFTITSWFLSCTFLYLVLRSCGRVELLFGFQLVLPNAKSTIASSKSTLYTHCISTRYPVQLNRIVLTLPFYFRFDLLLVRSSILCQYNLTAQVLKHDGCIAFFALEPKIKARFLFINNNYDCFR